MTNLIVSLLCLSAGFVLAASPLPPALENSPRALRIPDETREKIGKRIWVNECDGKVEGLVDWNAGEAFASLGIGHFIWYPTPAKGPFEESFPPLLAFLVQHGVTLPEWLSPDMLCPWPTKEVFTKASAAKDPRLADLRDFLSKTVPLQSEFIAARNASALARMLAICKPEQRDTLRSRFTALAATDDGLYCLLDYVNFKGEGIKSEESYAGEGWGLLQVILAMKGEAPAAQMNIEFSEASKQVLARRVKNSAPEKKAKETEWLAGWSERCNGYKKGL